MLNFYRCTGVRTVVLCLQDGRFSLLSRSSLPKSDFLLLGFAGKGVTSGVSYRLSLVILNVLADGNGYLRKGYGRVLIIMIQISFELLTARVSLFESSSSLY
jgi:hypothetical protein